MPPLTPASAIAAYANTARAGVPHAGAIEPELGPSFSQYVDTAARQALSVGKHAELESAKAVAGKADITEVVTAVANAEVTLQTVVAVRDRVVAAYQDIMRMPI